jgi:hypothetical protein
VSSVVVRRTFSSVHSLMMKLTIVCAATATTAELKFKLPVDGSDTIGQLKALIDERLETKNFPVPLDDGICFGRQVGQEAISRRVSGFTPGRR